MTTPGTRPPVETKTKAATGATFVAGLALWVLQKYVFKTEAVPDVLSSWIYAVAPAVIAFGAGYWAHHTYRPDLQPPQQQPGADVFLPPATGDVKIITPPGQT